LTKWRGSPKRIKYYQDKKKLRFMRDEEMNSFEQAPKIKARRIEEFETYRV
jgi:hypothetical protein